MTDLPEPNESDAVDEPDPTAAPEAPSRARMLSRGRRAPTRTAETGRRHHIGAAPTVMPLWKPDGTVTTTRTSAVQLFDQTDLQLRRLRADLEKEMNLAADSLDFEAAAHLRDEVGAVTTELTRRQERANGQVDGQVDGQPSHDTDG